MKKLLLKEIPDPYLKTVIELPSRNLIASFKHRFFLIGSCFARNIGFRLGELGLPSYYEPKSCNHFSVKSLLTSLQRIGKNAAPDTLVVRDGKSNQYVSLGHTDLRAGDKDELIERIQSLDKCFMENLKNADTLIVTLGCATYLMHTSKIVMASANGLDASGYQLLVPSFDEVRADLRELYRLLRGNNPTASIVFTVSPQRYSWNIPQQANGSDLFDMSDHLLHSNLDKYKLRLAVDELDFEPGDTYYPSYEIVMDELRAYESFNHDLKDSLHVNREFTPNYVINRFLESYCTEEMQGALEFFTNLLTPNSNRFYKRLHHVDSANQTAYIKSLLQDADGYLKPLHAQKLFNLLLGHFKLVGKSKLLDLGGELSEEARKLIENMFTSPIQLRPIGQPSPLVRHMQSVAVWGAGDTFIQLLPLLRDCRIACLVDSVKGGRHLFGIPIVTPSQLPEINGVDGIIVASLGSAKEILDKISAMKISHLKIITAQELIASMVPT